MAGLRPFRLADPARVVGGDAGCHHHRPALKCDARDPPGTLTQHRRALAAGSRMSTQEISTQDMTLTLETLLGQAAWLRRLARSLVGDAANAEDAVQDTLVAAWKHPPADPRNPRPWFGTVLTNRIRREIRQRKVHARAVTQVATLETLTAEARAPRTPEQVVTSIELQRTIAGMLLDLREPYREVIFLRYFEDLNASEIGARLGIPAGTVRWRLKEGLADLRRRLDAEDQEPGRAWRKALVPLAALGDRTVRTPQPLMAAAAATAFVVLAVVGGATVLHRGSPTAAAPTSTVVAGTAAAAGPMGSPPAARPTSLLAAAALDPSGAPEFGPPRAPRRSLPYSGLRWQGERPIARIGEEWIELLAIDGVPVADIIAFSKEENQSKKPGEWRKRIQEDVVSLLLGMGHALGPQARLEVKRPARAPEIIVAAVTAQNRERASTGDWVAGTARPVTLVKDWARVAPYTDARFDGETVYVMVDDRWYRLLAVNGVTTERLVAVARPFRRDWQKIVAEDTVELLTAATGRTPGPTVTLDLEPFGTRARVKREKVPMTEENLRKLRLTWR
jgi:RNA polymerase sigma-70 factor (ECF subfamily)